MQVRNLDTLLKHFLLLPTTNIPSNETSTINCYVLTTLTTFDWRENVWFLRPKIKAFDLSHLTIILYVLLGSTFIRSLRGNLPHETWTNPIFELYKNHSSLSEKKAAKNVFDATVLDYKTYKTYNIDSKLNVLSLSWRHKITTRRQEPSMYVYKELSFL